MIQYRKIRLSLAILVLFSQLLGGKVVRGDGGALVEGVVAVVNDRRILFSDVARAASGEYRKLAQVYSGQELHDKADEVYRETLSALIERQIILTSVENPNPEAINLMVEQQLDDVVRGSFKGDRGAFLGALAAEHLPLQAWKDEVRDNILISITKRNEVDSKILLSPGAARREYDASGDKYKTTESVRLRIIALRMGDADADKVLARQQADEIRKKAVEGADFVSLQKSVKKDRGTDGSLSDPEWVGLADLRPEVAKVVSGMNVGEVSPVVDAGDSYLICKVEDRRESKAMPFADARGAIERQLKLNEQRRLYDLWVAKLRKHAYVKVIQEGMLQK
ncbi:MAG: peptidyl-prolyl cis-trans isomerase [bacterium]